MIKDVIRIGTDETGKVFLNGPMNDKIFCLGLLEIAKQIVIEHGKKESDIIIPSPEDIIKGG